VLSSLRTAAVVVVLMAAASACRSTTTTFVRFDDAGQPSVKVSLELDGEAREVVASDDVLKGRIDALARKWFPAARSQDRDGVLSWESDATVEQVTGASQLTGVSELELVPGERPSLRAAVVQPAGLVAAIEGSEDRAAVPALLENVSVGLRVEFPGDVEDVDAGDLPARVQGGTVTMSQPLAAYRSGELSVTGRPSSGIPWAPLAVAAVMVGLTVTVAVAVRRGARPRDPLG